MIPVLLSLALPTFAQDGAERSTEPGPATEAPAEDGGDDAQEQAKLLYKNGATLYEEGLYEQAIKAFREALELSGNKKLLLNVANAQERDGALQAALDTLNEYRIYVDAEDEKATLDRRMRAIERRLDEERAAAAAAAASTATPAPSPVPVAPTTRPNTAKWVVFGLGAAVATGAGTMAAVTYSSGRGFADVGDQTAYENARTLNNVSLPIAGVGAGLAVIGIVLPGQRPVSISPNPLGGATLRMRF